MNYINAAVHVTKFLSQLKAFPNRNFEDNEIVATLRQVSISLSLLEHTH